MHTLALVAALQLAAALAPEPLPEAPVASSSRWLPRVTVRVTYRGQQALWLESLREGWSVPWGWSVELRLSWGFDAPFTPTLTTEPSP